jgi:hypothetical protein
VIYKNGAVPGYQAQISLFETEGIGISVAYNLTSSAFHAGNIGSATIIDDINTAIVNAEVARGSATRLRGSNKRGTGTSKTRSQSPFC